jgi:hypothetical protein
MEDSKDKFIAVKLPVQRSGSGSRTYYQMQDLISHLADLSDNLATERGEVENEKRLVAAFKEDLSIARKEIEGFQRAQVCPLLATWCTEGPLSWPPA